MLVLTRTEAQELHIDGPCIVRILRVAGGSVRIGLVADTDVRIRRGELVNDYGAEIVAQAVRDSMGQADERGEFSAAVRDSAVVNLAALMDERITDELAMIEAAFTETAAVQGRPSGAVLALGTCLGRLRCARLTLRSLQRLVANLKREVLT